MEQVLASTASQNPVNESVPIAQKTQGLDVDPELKRKNQ